MSNGEGEDAGRPKIPDPHPKVGSRELEGTICLQGYVGKSAHDDCISLHWSLRDFRMYIDIPKRAIKHLAEPQTPEEPTVFWVKADAHLVYHCNISLEASSGFLTGSIAEKHLPAARATAASSIAPTDSGDPHPDVLTPFTPCVTQRAMVWTESIITKTWCVPNK